MPDGPLVEMRGICKRFGPVQALDGVDLDLHPGEIHALLGENGAGKTTLMNVLYGLHQPDAGTVAVRGRQDALRTPQDAIAAGIGMVHQHFMLTPTLTVAENMVLGERGGPLLRGRDLAAVGLRLRELGERYGLEVDPGARVWQLSVGEQQRVEIIRALFHDARILILDEPTATLTPVETERLFPKLRALARERVAIAFITHHLEDVLRWADRITVLRRGKLAGMPPPAETSAQELARLMVGRDVTLMSVAAGERSIGAAAAEPSAAAGRPVLEVRTVSVVGDRGTPALEDVDFSVAAGEIVAIAGVEGNGQAELEEVLFGLRTAGAGTVLMDGRDVTAADPRGRLRLGLGLVPSDRYRRGVIRELSVADNLVLDRIDQAPYGSRLRVNRRAIRDRAQTLLERYQIHVGDPGQPCGTLSGGNVQRVVLARTLTRELRCLIAAQPTRGLDVGAIEFVWEQLAAARDAGLAIVLISTDLDEVMSMADRCCVLYRGHVVGCWDRHELDRERVGLAMGGLIGEAQAPPGTAALGERV
jgi:general nucleoside transport system ATP-binding protein